MTTTSLTATYKEGDHYVVEAEVDCLHFRYEFTDPDTEKELLWKMLDDEKDGLNPVARYEILDKAQAAIDSGILDNHPGYDWAPYFQAAEAVSDSPSIDEPTDCDCAACTQGHNALMIAELRSDGRSLRRQVFWSLVVIAIVAWFV
jgi:hypothetical protein